MKKTVAFLALLSASVSLYAATPLWLRDVKISPDGQQIAFCYQGDIFTVPAAGGEAKRITANSSFDSDPVWSPDGSKIAFASDRNGRADIYIVDANGGVAKRLTFNSAAEYPTTFTPDGSKVVFTATIQDPSQSIEFPSSRYSEVYTVPVNGGKTIQILGTPAESICYSPDGSFFLYQDKKGMENEWRKHHTSSVTKDIWKYDTKTGTHTNLTSRPGEDRNPVLSPDCKTVFCLSEPVGWEDGRPRPSGWTTSMNVYSFNIDNPSVLAQVSNFDTHPVRFLSQASTGLLCYTWDGEIYTQIPGQDPVKVGIDLKSDYENVPEKIRASSGASSAGVSPDGKELAFSLRGEIFVTSVEYNTTKQITHTAAIESDPVFASDNRTIVYTSERDGVRQLYKATIARKEDPNFENATLIDEEIFLAKPGVDRSNPLISPDGKHIAFIEDRTKLMVADYKSGKVREVTDGSTWYDRGDPFQFNWSPDGKWIALTYISNGRDPYYNIGIVSSEGGKIYPVTESAYMCTNPRFTSDGTGILFESERYGMRSHASWGTQTDAFLCFVNQEAYDKYQLSKEDFELAKDAAKADTTSKKKGVEVELKGLQDRIVRLTPNSSSLSDEIISKDGESLYYLARFEKGYDLWKMDIRTKETKLISKNAGAGIFVTDKGGKTIFLLGSSFKKLDGTSFKNISYSAAFELDAAAEREAMFNYVEREESERFYAVNMHGVNWKGYCDAYRKFLPHINNNYDFAEMLSELLGELNVSHTGSGYRASARVESTASLGVLYDLSYDGKGLKVAEVLTGGCFDHDNLKLEAGDIITKIDGVAITDDTDISTFLNGKAHQKTLVSVKGKGDMVVMPNTPGEISSLMYDRWVKQRAADVAKWSNGRLGYVHLASMNDASFRTIYSDILGKYNQCEGIVIDQRFNGGGRLHEDIEILFEGKKYLTQEIRGRDVCDMPSRRWAKPSIMVMCEADYSNAHGTPWVYKFKNIGKLVGAPVPGTMTSVNWVTLADASLYFGIPVIGYRTAEGYYLEDNQLEPDILVYNSPADILAGEDAQLHAAVNELLSELDN